MNRTIPRIGAILVTATVALFALFMVISTYASFIVCMILPIGYLMMIAGFHHESAEDTKVTANLGLIFGCIYAVLIFLVYFSQTTSVINDGLTGQALAILNYSSGGLMFNYDLLGYGMMALSTFFTGLSMKPLRRIDKWIKWLMIIHGVFFIGCFIMPMTGMFTSMSEGGSETGGIIALEFWCAYFLPIGILSIIHFRKKNTGF